MNKYIDHTILKPFATKADIIKLCGEAKEYGFKSVCINPCHIDTAKQELAGSGVLVCTVIGFPLGANTTKTKVFETLDAYNAGCDEFDMVINIGALKAGDTDYVRRDIEEVVAAAKGRIVKVIIETFYLTDKEKVAACKIAEQAGAHFVKTCTGFNDGIATEEDVRLMRAAVSGNVEVKASSGIRSKDTAELLIRAGAGRIGTSAGISIVKA